MEETPYIAISISILARFIFLYLLYKNKSRNNYSLAFCILNIGSSGIWLAYGLQQKDLSLITRSSTEVSLLLVSVIYIIRNKVRIGVPITPAQHPPDPPAEAAS
jgi:uncharacterized protein with PQ loop repeat